MLASGDQEIRWFDYWLKGIDNGIMDEPPVTYFMMGPAEKGAVSRPEPRAHAADWPVAHRDVRYYLTRRKSAQPAPANRRRAPSSPTASIRPSRRRPSAAPT